MTAGLEGGEWSAARPGRFTPRKDPVPIVLEAGWAPGPVWTVGKSRPHRNSIPNRPARSQSLHRLSYLARIWFVLHYNKLQKSLLFAFIENSTKGLIDCNLDLIGLQGIRWHKVRAQKGDYTLLMEHKKEFLSSENRQDIHDYTFL